MKALRDPKRLRALAAPGSVLECGLASARDRGPSDAELRALGAALFAATAAATVAPTVKAGASGWRLLGLAKSTTAALVTAGAVAGASGLAWHHHRAVRATEQVSFHSSSARVTRPAPAPEVVVPEPRPPAAVAHRAALPSIQRKNPLPAARAATDAADEELTLIGAAEHALAGNPARALALVREHERRYPQGLLVQEREVIAVSALWAAGQHQEARRRAARFTGEHPGSTYVARMRRIVAQTGDALINDAAADHQRSGDQR